MDFHEIKPYIRHAEQLKEEECLQPLPTAAYDHTLLYIVSGHVRITIGEEKYSPEKGSVLILKPGTFFRITDQEQLTMIWIHFDYTGDNSVENAFYLRPQTRESFQLSRLCGNVFFREETCFNSTVFVSGFHHMEETFKSIVSEFGRRDKYFDFRMSCCLSYLLIDISREAKVSAVTENKDAKNTVGEIIEFIHENYNRDITNEMIASHFSLPPKHVNSLVKAKTGYPIHKYIILRRITKAIELLQSSDLRIYEIAETVGFSDECHFSKCFKQMMGKSPRSFRNGRKQV